MAGYIACEMASIMNGFGVNTKLIYRGDQILRGFDKEIRDHVAEEMAKNGILISLIKCHKNKCDRRGSRTRKF